MVVVVKDLLTRLLDSGLISRDEFSSLRRLWPSDQQETDAEAFVRTLVEKGKLTEYQAAELCQRNGHGLVYGDYVVLSKIGQGGMGIVLKARHRLMDRIVALKILPEAALTSSDAIERFYREVKAAARLHHPNIVTAYDAGECNGTHYLVMEYVEGEDLASIARREKIPTSLAVNWIL